MASQDVRYYLNGLLLEINDGNLIAVATDGHRLASSSSPIDSKEEGTVRNILPRKAVIELAKILRDEDDPLGLTLGSSSLRIKDKGMDFSSKLIDGKFPNYVQVIPKNNQKKLEVNLQLFLDSVDRVASVSLDKKDGVKFNLTKDTLNLSVNNANSGDGKESLNVKFDHDLEISFNSRYLIDVASQLDGDKIEIFFNDTGSPALIKDPSDFDSIYVVMPMKG